MAKKGISRNCDMPIFLLNILSFFGKLEPLKVNIFS